MTQAPRIAVMTVGAVGVLALAGPPVVPRNFRLVYNPTTSAPAGWYMVDRHADLRVDDYVLAPLPGDAARLADERQYLPLSVPILKRVGAVGSQSVCISGNAVLIAGRLTAQALRRDSRGRELAVWKHCRPLTSDELFLLSVTNPASFDSRYFGPILRGSVIGKAIPLWTW
jgi:conjugative transfer signal peptidase TraF